MKKHLLLILISILGLQSCGTDSLKSDNALVLKGPIQIGLTVSDTDSVIDVGYRMKISYDKPDSLITADNIVIRNITAIKMQNAFDITKIEGNNSFVRKENFETGSPSTGKSRAFINIAKGQNHWEDNYICRDTGLFWINYVAQPVDLYIWTGEGKEYRISVTLGVVALDHHKQMLLNYAPYLYDMLQYEEGLGFGHYCFKVVP